MSQVNIYFLSSIITKMVILGLNGETNKNVKIYNQIFYFVCTWSHKSISVSTCEFNMASDTHPLSSLSSRTREWSLTVVPFVNPLEGLVFSSWCIGNKVTYKRWFIKVEWVDWRLKFQVCDVRTAVVFFPGKACVVSSGKTFWLTLIHLEPRVICSEGDLTEKKLRVSFYKFFWKHLIVP